MSRARQLALSVALFGVSVATFGAGAYLLLKRQAVIARRRIGKPLGEIALDSDKLWRASLDGQPIELLVLGDSLAAGLGAEKRKHTFGARLAKEVGVLTGRPVQLRTAAVVGSESHMLAEQMRGLPDTYLPDVAVIVVGGNDVTHLISPAEACSHLEHAVRSLRSRGTEVVVGTCPDLGSLRAVPQPLRSLLSRMSKRMARAQTRTVSRAGGVAVSLRHTVGPVFRAEPGKMFSLDQFHPSAAGYRRTAAALAPAVAEATQTR